MRIEKRKVALFNHSRFALTEVQITERQQKRKHDGAISDDHSVVSKRIQPDECTAVNEDESSINIGSKGEEKIVW